MRAAASAALLCLAASAPAATWYVDSGAAGSRNGASWANAWTSLSSISGVSAGDTVYISGGPAGSTRTYSIASWAVPNGVAGNPITYQIGQDALHNGTAIFSNNGSGGLLTAGAPPNHTVISGNAGDGQLHFQLSGFGSLFDSGNVSVTDWHFCYVNMPSMNTGSGARTFDLGTVYTLEIDHLYCVVTGAAADKFVNINNAQGTGFDQILFHDITLFIPNGSSGFGADGIDWGGTGVSLYNCQIIGYGNNYSGTQHQDGTQVLNGSYIKIYGNTFYNCFNYAVYMEAAWVNDVYNYLWIYNNVVINCEGGGIVCGPDTSGDGFNNTIIANNVVDNSGQSLVLGNVTSYACSFQNDLIANNIVINGSYLTPNNPSTPMVDNISLSPSQAASFFVNYTALSTNSNYHLTASATSLIGKGTNLSALFSADKAGNARPASGAWDIGPYDYQSVATASPVIAVSPASQNAGTIAVGGSSSVSFKVQNSGSGTLAGAASVAAPFQVASGGSYSLSAGQSQTVAVTYTPSAAGSSSQTVTFTGGGGAAATVSGTATNASSTAASPVIAVSPPSLNFGTVSAGTTNALTFTVKNTGSGTLTGTATVALPFRITAGGSYSLGANQSQIVAIAYVPTVAGTNSQSVALTGAAGASVAVTGSATAAQAAPSGTGLTFAAGAATLTAPLVLNGGAIYQTETVGTVAGGGQAVFTFTITNAGNYAVQALVNAPDTSANSFWLNVDAQPTDPTMVWDVPVTSGFQRLIASWRGNGVASTTSSSGFTAEYAPKIFTLTSGTHQLIIVGREWYTELESVSIIAVPPVPQDVHVVSSP
jgi:hypothetical protein